MAKIKLSEGFSLIPKGTHVFQIVKVSYKEDYGKMEVTMQTASGQKHIERFSLLKKDGEPNEGALNAFSYFAKTALDDFDVAEIDHKDLLGRFIRCEVDYEEVESNRTPDKMLTFVRLGEKSPADGFDEPVKASKTQVKKDTTPVEKAAKKPKFNLDSILN